MTPKQQRFVAEYLVDLNATQAAVRAGYSKRNADKIGSELLGKTGVAQAVQEGQAAKLKKVGVTAERTILEIQRIAFSDIRKLFTDYGGLKPVHELNDDESALLASVEVLKKNLFAGDKKVDTIHKLKVWDKLKALEMLAKHFGILQERVEHHGKIEIVVTKPW